MARNGDGQKRKSARTPAAPAAALAETRGDGLSKKAEKLLDLVLERIRDTRNMDFRNYKRATLGRRIERRMAERKVQSVTDYLKLLERDSGEFDALISSLLIKVTSFFRDPEAWEELSRKAIPQLLATKRPGEEIRVWCAGCATGEEAFSAALLLAEAMGPAFNNQDIKVFGTDVDEKAIAYARRGIYTAAQVESVPKQMLADWFVQDAAGYCVRKEIRRSVVFGVNNLVSDAPISRLDLLLCRNVFIYLDAQLQKRVLMRFHYALRRHGVLMLGKSELIPFAARIYEPVDLARRIYRKDGRGSTAVSQERLVGLLSEESESRERGEEPQVELGTTEQFHRDVLQSASLPIVATALDGTVLLWNSAAASLWGRPEADATGKRLAVLNLPGLAGELLIERTAAVREGRSEREWGQGVVSRSGDRVPLQIAVEVTVLRDAGRQPSGLLYVVHDVTSLRDLEAEARKANEERQSAFEELQTINEEMQSSNEELETTNEELQSANEELQTTNEELQSTNEELETTNEELQSTNAELDASNRELAHRTEEMNNLSFYHRTLIRSLSAGIVVIDPAGRVTMWNLAAERLLGLAEGEAVGQMLWTLHVPALARPVLSRVRKALAKSLAHRAEDVEYELPNGARGRATLAAVPIIDGGVSLGAVIIFEDTTRTAKLSAENARLRQVRGRK